MHSKVTMLPVGQGAMNLIEIYDDRGALASLTLIDCGSIDGHELSKEACEESLQYAAGKMSERWNDQEHIYLDHLWITHKDGDHWNLLNRLFEKVIGADAALVNESIGYFQMEEEADYTVEYYRNNIEGVSQYSKSYSCDCDIEWTCTYQASEGEIKQEVTLEYEYEDNVMIVRWSPTHMGITILDAAAWFNKLANFSLCGMYHIHLGEGWEKVPLPQDYNGFLQLFSGIYASIKQLIPIPEIHDGVILGLLQTAMPSPEMIEKCTLGNPDSVPKFIRNLCIGGNALYTGKQFAPLKKTLNMISENLILFPMKGSSYLICENFYLYIIEKLSVFELSSLEGAESVTKPSIKNNATSIVSVLAHPNPFFINTVFTGDATVHTFYQMLLDFVQGKVKVDYRNAVWTAPHHGAYTTLRGQIPENGGEVFSVLLRETVPGGMVISAGLENTHGHPCNSFVGLVNDFFQYSEWPGEEHFVYHNTTDSCKRSGAVWDFFETILPLYTTYTVLDRESGRQGYRYYEFSFQEQSNHMIQNMPWHERRGGTEKITEQRIKIPVMAEAPSKSMFFHRR